MIFSDDDVNELVASFIREVRLAEERANQTEELSLSDDERSAIKSALVLETAYQIDNTIARIFITQPKVTKCEVPKNDHLAYARDVKACLNCGKTCCKRHMLRNCPHCGTSL